MGAKDAQRVALLAEVALLRSQAAKAEQRIGVLEGEVVALMAQAEQSSYEHELAQQVQRLLSRRLHASSEMGPSYAAARVKALAAFLDSLEGDHAADFLLSRVSSSGCIYDSFQCVVNACLTKL